MRTTTRGAGSDPAPERDRVARRRAVGAQGLSGRSPRSRARGSAWTWSARAAREDHDARRARRHVPAGGRHGDPPGRRAARGRRRSPTPRCWSTTHTCWATTSSSGCGAWPAPAGARLIVAHRPWPHPGDGRARRRAHPRPPAGGARRTRPRRGGQPDRADVRCPPVEPSWSRGSPNGPRACPAWSTGCCGHCGPPARSTVTCRPGAAGPGGRRSAARSARAAPLRRSPARRSRCSSCCSRVAVGAPVDGEVLVPRSP